MSHGDIRSPHGSDAAWMIGTLEFDDLASIQRAFESEAGKACAVDRRKFAPDDSTFQMFMFDATEV